MKKVLIIGANRGIGLALAATFKENSFHVIATCRQASDSLKKLDVEVVEGVSMGEDASFLSLKDKIQTIDYLVHNAGIMRYETLSSLEKDFDFSSIEEQFQINSLAPLKVVIALKNKIKPQGKIALITSRMGSLADNTSGSSYGYRASKAALNMFAKSLSVDLVDKKISVAALHPGWVKTRMTGNQGLLDVEESAQGIYNRIEGLSLENSGGFWHTNGESLRW